MRLQTKVLISLGSSLLVTGLLIAGFFGSKMSTTMIADSKASMRGQLQVLTELMDGYRLQTERLANDHFSVLSQTLVGSWSLSPEQPSITVGKSFPTLKLNGKPVNNDYGLTDRFTQSLGSVATIFVRNGEDFARITTSLKNDEGQRAVGTLLDRQHPAYKALLEGKPYLGRARLFGRDFMTRYQAIVDERNHVVGALFIGVDFTQSFSALKDSIKKMHVGKEGYFFAIDINPGKARGTAMIHPDAEGKNIYEASSDNKTAATLLESTASQSEGFIEYTWSAAQQPPTVRYAAFRSYAPWKLQLFATIDQDEILQPAHQTALSLGLIMMLCLAAITVFAVWLVNRLVIRPLGGEPEDAAKAVRRIAAGDLTIDLHLKAGDRHSLLYSLKTMQGNLSGLVSDIRNISDAAASRGDFSVKIRLEGKEGFMAELATLLNKLSSVTETGLNDISRVAQALARGDLDQTITRAYPGLFGQTTSSVNQTVAALSGIVTEIRAMVSAAKEGNFSVKLEMANKQGYTEDLGQLLNQLSDVTEEGLEEIRRVAQALAAGDLSQTVTRDYPGIFGQTTTSVNQTVNALSRIVAEIHSVVAAAGQGDFSVKLNMADKQGYSKDLSQLLNRLSDVTEDGLKEIRRVANALAAGDLTQTVTRSYPGIFGQTTEGMNNTVANLSRLIDEIQQSVRAITTAVQELASGNRDLSSRTEEQASSLEETAASMEELNQTVKQNMENAHHANELAKTSNTMANKGGELVGRVVGTMSEIQESSKRIADILTLIDGIAFQTNILALNAAVEAARAGEQGRGFAVVASEVRSLAQRSAAAAKEIKTLIATSVDKIECGAQQVHDAGTTMREVVASFENVTHLIEGINLASLEQGNGIEQVAQAVSQMDEVTQQNAALVEQASAATESLESQAEGLMRAAARFRLQALDESNARKTLSIC